MKRYHILLDFLWIAILAGGSLSPAPAVAQANELSIGFYAAYDAAYRPYVEAWFAAAYPGIVAVLGEPFGSRRICFRPKGDASSDPSCSATITSSYPQITLPYSPANPTDPTWDNDSLTEMIYAHHGFVYPLYSVGTTSYGDWLEVGLAEASTWLVAEYIQASGGRNMIDHPNEAADFVRDYEIGSLAGAAYWGGSPVPMFKVNPLHAHGMAGALFWLAATSQQPAAGPVNSGDWLNYDWFRRLNAVAYAWKSAHPSANMSSDQFYALVDQVSPQTFDGQKLSDWIKAQPITRSGNPPGYYMGAFPDSYTEPNMVEVNIYTLDSSNPAVENYYGSNVEVAYTAYNYRNELVPWEPGSFTAYFGTAWVRVSGLCSHSGGGGAIRMEFQATVEGRLLTTRTAFLCTSLSFNSAAAGVGLLLMNPDGTLFNGTATSTGGIVTYNPGGGAVLAPYNTGTLPKTIGVGFKANPVAALDLRSWQADSFIYLPLVLRIDTPPPDDWFYSLPLPYTRVIVAIKP